MAEVIVYFLATHCMLAHNEVRHNTIINMYNQAVQQAGKLPETTLELESLEPTGHSLPQDCSVIIKLDAFVTSESTHSELCKALKVSSFPNRKMRIFISRLAMTCLGHARISLLLKQLDPQYLTGLQLQYNALTARDLVKLAPAMKTLVSLESLDLSCNSIFFYQHDEACTAAGEIFGIAEMDLSENQLKTCDRQVREILGTTRSSLLVLEMEDCSLDDQAVLSFIPNLSRLNTLMYINIAENRLSQNCLTAVMAAVAELVSMHVFKSSYAVECYENENEAEEDRRKVEAVGELNAIANRSSVHALRRKSLQLVMTELEKVMDTEN
nr:hypothetical protein BaRGS_032658 [Batillaria attramentaria]